MPETKTEKRLSCKELAAALGYHPTYISAMKRAGFPDVAQPSDGDGGFEVAGGAFKISGTTSCGIFFRILFGIFC